MERDAYAAGSAINPVQPHTSLPSLRHRPFVVGLEAQRWALSRPAFDTRNGTTKFNVQRTHVAAVA